LHDLHKFLTVAESLGDGGVVESRGAGGGGGVAGSDAVSTPKETSPSPSSCGMAPIRSASAPLCPLVGSTGCGRFRLAGGAGGDGLVTAPALLAVAVAITSFLAAARVRRIAPSAVGSDAFAASQ
jgi:hypothetical protein